MWEDAFCTRAGGDEETYREEVGSHVGFHEGRESYIVTGITLYSPFLSLHLLSLTYLPPSALTGQPFVRGDVTQPHHRNVYLPFTGNNEHVLPLLFDLVGRPQSAGHILTATL